MNQKKLKIILFLPLALFFIVSFFYFPLPAKAVDCGYIGSRPDEDNHCVALKSYSVDNSYCEGQTKPPACSPGMVCTCCCDEPVAAAPSKINATMPKINIPDIKLQIPIPGLNLTKGADILAKCEKDEKGRPTNCSFPWIGEYIAGIYKYAIGIVGILAAVVLMIGGVIWIMAGGSATMISESKAWIGASLTGLVIALTSYIILYQVNPALVGFKGLDIQMVEKLTEAQNKYANMGCPSTEEINNGYQAFTTGYCKPQPSAADKTDGIYNDSDFLCKIGLNCTCPSGQDTSSGKTCGNSFRWSPCKPFSISTPYCNQTANGGEPGAGQVAADWSCSGLSKNADICIGGKDYKITDQGSAIKGKRFDIFVENCNDAGSVTKVQDVKIKSCN